MRVRKLQSDKYMCCVEVAVVSACGGGGCIVVMRWIVAATVRVKHGLTVEQLSNAMPFCSRHHHHHQQQRTLNI